MVHATFSRVQGRKSGSRRCCCGRNSCCCRRCCGSCACRGRRWTCCCRGLCGVVTRRTCAINAVTSTRGTVPASCKDARSKQRNLTVHIANTSIVVAILKPSLAVSMHAALPRAERGQCGGWSSLSCRDWWGSSRRGVGGSKARRARLIDAIVGQLACVTLPASCIETS